MTPPLLEITSLFAGYGKEPVLRDISGKISHGSLLGILGPNGSGKSTLLKCICNNLRPMSGSVTFKDRNVSTIPAKTLARQIACVGKSVKPVDMPCLQYVLLGRFPWLSWLGFFKQKDVDIAKASLRQVGLEHKEEAKLGALSAGQWQLAALARALAQIWDVEAPLLLLDEPAANLDINRRMEIFELLRGLTRRGWTIVAAMHDCNLASLFCDQLLGIKNGLLLFFGSTEVNYTLENLDALYDWPLGIFAHPDSGAGQIYPRMSGYRGSSRKPADMR